MSILHIDHVQLAIPEGAEPEARTFYGALLGLPEREKPEYLRQRGGVWFERGSLKLHLGVERDFRPAKKAHPALVAADLTDLAARLREAGYEVTEDEAIDGYPRAFVHDPFGNRIELIASERST